MKFDGLDGGRCNYDDGGSYIGTWQKGRVRFHKIFTACFVELWLFYSITKVVSGSRIRYLYRTAREWRVCGHIPLRL